MPGSVPQGLCRILVVREDPVTEERGSKVVGILKHFPHIKQ